MSEGLKKFCEKQTLYQDKTRKTRKNISKANDSNRAVLVKKYKILRNKTTASIRKDNLDFNKEQIDKANDEKEFWNIVNEVANPKLFNSSIDINYSCISINHYKSFT